MAKKKVLVALSGGVDSAVSALLLIRQGYDVEAAFMKNWSSTEGLIKADCPWLEDRREALRVAAFLGIPLHTFDFEKQYKKQVMNYFFQEYKRGRTPNPDVMCNKEIKFKLLYIKAMDMGFDYLATGHYAQIKKVGKELALLRGKDEFKDQTYFIYNIRKEQLGHLMFPIGGYKKTEVRKIAVKAGLPNAFRKESMGLCFVGRIELDRFLAQKIKPKRGDIVNTEGKVVGKHNGAAFYTLGQRQGLGIGGSGPWYVVAKDIKKNRIVVAKNPSSKEFTIRDIQISSVNWISTKLPLRAKGRFRHQQKLQDLAITKKGRDLYNILFAKPQAAVASGQSLVLYSGKVCLGGGVIV